MTNASGYTALRNSHLNKLLTQGVDSWNQWRKESKLRPLLTGGSLASANLRGADLRNALMKKVNLNHADLREANLEGADLFAASLLNVLMPDANLRKVNLSAAVVNGDLRRVDLTNAQLQGTQIYGSLLTGANFERAVCQSTVFAASDLSGCTGLQTVRHLGPSTIGVDTIYDSNGDISKRFLRGARLHKTFIARIPALMDAVNPAQFYSCFISYSHADQEFAQWLYQRLRAKRVECWLDEKQMKPGDRIYEEISKGIQRYDKFLLCCSEQSLTSWWVGNEIKTALEKELQLKKERGTKIQCIIPLDLDGYISDNWKSGYGEQIRGRMAANFKGWGMENTKFHSEITSLIGALRADKGAREKPPSAKL